MVSVSCIPFIRKLTLLCMCRAWWSTRMLLQFSGLAYYDTFEIVSAWLASFWLKQTVIARGCTWHVRTLKTMQSPSSMILRTRTLSHSLASCAHQTAGFEMRKDNNTTVTSQSRPVKMVSEILTQGVYGQHRGKDGKSAEEHWCSNGYLAEGHWWPLILYGWPCCRGTLSESRNVFKAQHIGSIQDAVQTLGPLEVAFEVLGNSRRCFARSFPECRIPKGPERTWAREGWSKGFL